MEEDDFSSDSSDEDYVPDVGEAVSEEEESGDDEDFVTTADNESEDVQTKNTKSTKKKAATSKKNVITSRKRKGGIRLDDEKNEDTEQAAAAASSTVPDDDAEHHSAEIPIAQESNSKKGEDQKKKADDLWADFLKDVGGTKPNKSTGISNKTTSSDAVTSSSTALSAVSSALSTSKPSTVKVTKEYDFAGETVTVVKEVPIDSKEAKEVLLKQSVGSETQPEASCKPSLSSSTKRPATGGLSAVLGKIEKKPKISVLDKSKIDWDNFKDREGIADELKIHNRGKEGYLERQAFLQRTDYRQFEIERSLRQNQSSEKH